MDIQAALDIVVARTRHERYRELCDPAHPDYNPAVADYVLALAAQPTPVVSRATPAPPAIPLAGDLVEALAARIGADRAAQWIADKLGTDCGCAARREKMNKVDRILRRWLSGRMKDEG